MRTPIDETETPRWLQVMRQQLRAAGYFKAQATRRRRFRALAGLKRSQAVRVTTVTNPDKDRTLAGKARRAARRDTASCPDCAPRQEA